MYKITEELNTNGFSINRLQSVIERNNGLRSFNTMEYFCIYIVFNHAAITVENKKYEVDGPHLMFIGPSKDIVYGSTYKEDNIYVVAFSATFYERSTKDSLFLNSELFFNRNADIFIAPTIANEYDVQKFIIERLALYKNKEKGLYISIAHNCVEALILDGLLTLDEEGVEHDHEKFTAIDTVNKFRVLLQKKYLTEKSVKYYATSLNITTRRLTEMTEQILGKKAKQVIIDRVVKEGVRQLLHSRLSIADIAYNLNFNDEPNFSAFVKKHTGKSPREIRKAIL